ncbi:MAG: hypothetical protein JW817_02280 [Clostridiales bacterium]|nr:hypothetical protein [Clostridiales bacterium]
MKPKILLACLFFAAIRVAIYPETITTLDGDWDISMYMKLHAERENVIEHLGNVMLTTTLQFLDNGTGWMGYDRMLWKWEEVNQFIVQTRGERWQYTISYLDVDERIFIFIAKLYETEKESSLHFIGIMKPSKTPISHDINDRQW